MKKLALLLAVVMVLSVLLAACGGTSGSANPSTPSTPDSSGSSAPEEPENPWSGLDTSTPVKLVMYSFGTEPNEMDRIVEYVNEKMTEKINTTVEYLFVTGADEASRYALLVAGGEQCDLIFTANYRYYTETVAKGGFYELSEEFLQTYMPVTYGILPASAWDEVRVNEKIYCVPRNDASIFPERGPTINSDIYGLYDLDGSKITDYESFEDALLTIAGGEQTPDGVFAYYCTSAATLQQFALLYPNNLNNAQISGGFYCQMKEGPEPENWIYLYTSDYYKEYCLRMAEYAEAGVWPTNAITQTSGISTLFTEGKSATTSNNYFNGIANLTNYREKGMNVEQLNIFPKDYRSVRDAYAGDCYAITAFCENPERAAIALDLMKTDTDVNRTLIAGFEGEHHVYFPETNTIGAGPNVAEYPFDTWAWGLHCLNMYWPAGEDEICYEVTDWLNENMFQDGTEWKYWGFAFDYSSVAAEKAVLDALISEYGTSFSLGQFAGDTEAKYEEFKNEMEAAGLAKYSEAYMTQLTAFYEAH